MSKRKIYVVGGRGWSASSYCNWMQGKVVDDIKIADLVLFTGGEDISPYIYGAEKHPYTHNNPRRDAEELIEFNMARTLKKPMIGICRGLI